jgi:hypothetical protein
MRKFNPAMQKAIAAAYTYSDNPIDDFKQDARAYLKALKEGRVLYNVEHVSASGMTRFISVKACEKVKGENRYIYRTFHSLLVATGHQYSRKYKGYSAIGCGMNMVFAMNYYLVRELNGLGLVKPSDLKTLEQAIQ